MALTYASQSGELTNQLSSASNLWWDRNFFPTAVSNNGIMFAMALAAGGPLTSPNIGTLFVKQARVEGNYLVTRHLGELETINFVADADQSDIATVDNNSNAFGGRIFDWAHMYHNELIPTSELAIIRGQSAQTSNWEEDVMNKVKESFLNTIDTGIMGNSNASRTAISGLQYAIDTTNTYGGINRATAGNENFQSTRITRANLTLGDVDNVLLSIIQKGGRGKIGVCGKTPYLKLMDELKSFTRFTDSNWDERFKGGLSVGYMDVRFAFDHKGTDTDLFILDPRALRFYMDKTFVREGPVYTGQNKGAHPVFVFDWWTQFVVANEGWCGRIDSITS